MKSIKAKRSAHLLQKEISHFIHRDFQNISTTGILSITKVIITDNLKLAKIYVSIFGGTINEKKTLQRLNNMKWNIRKKISKSLIIRHVPELLFILDTLMHQPYNDPNKE